MGKFHTREIKPPCEPYSMFMALPLQKGKPLTALYNGTGGLEFTLLMRNAKFILLRCRLLSCYGKHSARHRRPRIFRAVFRWFRAARELHLLHRSECVQIPN